MKKLHYAALLLFAPLGAVLPTHVAAQEPTSAEPARLVVARQIVDIAYPPEEREAMFMATVDQMEAQMLQSLSGQIKEDGAIDIIRDFQKEARADQERILRSHIPNLMDGWTRAYADIFSAKELSDILAFLKTETGRTFMMRNAAIMSNPHFAQANQAFMDESMSATMAKIPDLMKSLIDYRNKQESK